jgi:hypothetical protein
MWLLFTALKLEPKLYWIFCYEYCNFIGSFEIFGFPHNGPMYGFNSTETTSGIKATFMFRKEPG